MIINGRTFNDIEVSNLLYKANATFLSKAEVFLRRLYHLISTFTWINSLTIYNSVGNDREKLVSIFKNADVNPIIKRKIEDATAAIFKRQSNLEAVKQIAKPLKFYNKAERKDADFVKMIQLSEKASLNESEKQQFESLNIDYFKSRLSALHKEIYIKLSGSTESQINSWFDELIKISSYLSAKEKDQVTYHSLAQKTLLKALEQPTHMERLVYFIDNTSDDRDVLIAYRNTLLRNMNTLLDKRIENLRKIVDSKVDLSKVQHFPGAPPLTRQLNNVLLYLKKPELTAANKFFILDYLALDLELEDQLTTFARDYQVQQVPEVSDEIINDIVTKIRCRASDPEGYKRFLPPESQYDFETFMNGFYVGKFVLLAHKTKLSRQDRFNLSKFNWDTFQEKIAILPHYELKSMYSSGITTVNPEELKRQLDNEQLTKHYLDRVIIEFFNAHHFSEILTFIKTTNIANYREFYDKEQKLILDVPIVKNELDYNHLILHTLTSWYSNANDKANLRTVLNSIYIKIKYSIGFHPSLYSFKSFIRDTVDFAELPRFENADKWEKSNSEDREIYRFLVSFNKGLTQDEETLESLLKTKSNDNYFAAKIKTFAEKNCPVRTRVPI